MISVLAQCWCVERVTPAPGLVGYWHVDEATPFDLTGLAESPPRGPFYLDTGPPARLRPLVLAEQPTNNPAYYLEVLVATSHRLRLALWMQYPPATSYSHRLTYELAPTAWA
jgi:hypothetical protein